LEKYTEAILLKRQTSLNSNSQKGESRTNVSTVHETMDIAEHEKGM
jgi:hypothetical protein